MARPGEVLDIKGSFQLYLDMMFKGMPINPIQRNELEKAYYAGVGWLLTVQRDYVATLTEEQGVQFLQNLFEQIIMFALQLPNNGQEPHFTEEPVQPSKPH